MKTIQRLGQRPRIINSTPPTTLHTSRALISPSASRHHRQYYHHQYQPSATIHTDHYHHHHHQQQQQQKTPPPPVPPPRLNPNHPLVPPSPLQHRLGAIIHNNYHPTPGTRMLSSARPTAGQDAASAASTQPAAGSTQASGTNQQPAAGAPGAASTPSPAPAPGAAARQDGAAADLGRGGEVREQEEEQEEEEEEEEQGVAPSGGALSLPAPSEGGDVQTLEVDGKPITLDHMGPIVVHKDGTMSRIANWSEMAEIERRNTMRILIKRNQVRLSALREALPKEGERETKASS
ncbi:hypothetical protein VM1G_03485 [Cytospora mali]|uniref:Uncharacterized protein n=1 Tax=Cytospora mali TaxID=578113 RepID=A0A194VTW8_CYTMA|nr:hypothetical protein VM1G_03485 [Valsa mali]